MSQVPFDRPRIIQRTHVQLILDTPPLKEGNSKELRRLHDIVQQHVRALKTLGCDLSGQFITSMIELKLDTNTLFEWQKHSQTETDVPHYQSLLDFLDLRAEASEVSCSLKKPASFPKKPISKVAAHSATQEANGACPACTTESHPMHTCGKFKSMPHESKLQTVRNSRLCTNCLGGGHFKSQCKSVHKCKVCQKPHHTLLHSNAMTTQDQPPNQGNPPSFPTPVGSHAALRVGSDVLLMTSRVLITAPDGSTIEARALLDNASSASFISKRLANSLSLPRARQSMRVSGIGGMSHKPPLQAVTQFRLSSVKPGGRKIDVTAIIVPKVTCDLPMSPITFQMDWTHISNLSLADPGFAQPGRIDILLGADIYSTVLRHGRQDGPPNSPTAFETDLGWVLCGSASPSVQANVHITAFHTSLSSGDDVLCKFWELEEAPSQQACQSAEERMVVRHFNSNHSRSEDGRLIVPLPRNPEAKSLGESRSQAVKRFLSLERSLNQKGCFQEFNAVMREYFDLGHAEPVPTQEMDEKPELCFCLPMHAVYKTSSTTTKIRAVFDASAKSSTGVSLNDTLLVGPTLHPPLVDVLLRL